MSAGLTIGIPVYNGEGTLERCLDSALAWAPPGAQILVADNASDDGTEGICRRFAGRAKNLRYVRHERNIGGDANFRFLLQEARTPYFMWLADDDWLEDDFAARAVAFLEKNPDYVLATAASCYYNAAGEYQFTTYVSGVEDADPCRRVVRYLENLTDNSEFYGVYRRAALRYEAPEALGADWIVMMDTAFSGKVHVVEGAAIHRRYRWDSPDRHAEIAARTGLPAAQAAEPHYATALAALIHVAVGSPHYARLTEAERVDLAAETFRQFRAHQRLPAEFSFWRDARRFFGEERAVTSGKALRLLLLRLCEEPKVAQDVLELALWMNLGTEALAPEEEKALAAVKDSLAGRALSAPAWRQAALPGFDELPPKLTDAWAHYLTAPERFFDAEADIEAYAAHLRRVVDSLLAQKDPDAVDACVKRLYMVPCYFAAGSLKPLMQKRAELATRWLREIGIDVDGAARTGPAPAERLRVGLLLRDAVALTDPYTALPAIAALDRSRFETVIFVTDLAQGPGKLTAMEQFALSLAERSMLLGGDLAAMVATLREQELDFLLLGNNVTAVSSVPFYLSLCRVARWQVAFNPCCVTTGAANVDYFVSGTLLEEGGEGQAAYSEKLLQIPGPGHARLVPPFQPEVGLAKPAATRTDGEIRLVSGANYFKLTPAVRRTWAKLLAALPGATLALYPFGPTWTDKFERERLARTLRKEAQAAGADPGCIRLQEPFREVADVQAFLGTMDLYLDTFPFSGINSLLDPLLAGIPVIALAGTGFRSNMGASVLREIGFGDWVADSPARYVELARGLAGDRARLEEAKRRVHERMLLGTRFHDVAWFSGEFGRLMEGIAAAPGR